MWSKGGCIYYIEEKNKKDIHLESQRELTTSKKRSNAGLHKVENGGKASQECHQAGGETTTSTCTETTKAACQSWLIKDIMWKEWERLKACRLKTSAKRQGGKGRATNTSHQSNPDGMSRLLLKDAVRKGWQKSRTERREEEGVSLLYCTVTGKVQVILNSVILAHD
jgi:hypothetical protein